MFKNTASQKLIVYAFDSTANTPKTGDAANITAYVSKDYGAVTVLGDTSATEMDATNAKGYYLFDLTQAESNADTLLFSGKSSTSNIVVLAMPATVFTVPANFTKLVIDSSGLADANTVKLGPTGAGTAQTARDVGLSVLLSSGTGTGQLSLSSGAVLLQATQTGVTIPTVTNLTNAPTAGDLTATMKTSVTTAATAATPIAASVTGAVGSVTGNVGGNVTGTVASVVGNVGGNVSGNVTGSVGSVVGAVGSLTTNNDKTGYALTSGERDSVADALLNRDMSTGTDSGSTTVRTMRQALRFLRNKWTISGGALVVYKENDSTSSWTATATQTAGNPVSEIDPA